MNARKIPVDSLWLMRCPRFHPVNQTDIPFLPILSGVHLKISPFVLRCLQQHNSSRVDAKAGQPL